MLKIRREKLTGPILRHKSLHSRIKEGAIESKIAKETPHWTLLIKY